MYPCLNDNSPEVIGGRGANRIPEAESEPLWRRFLQKFRDPLIIILCVALLLSCGVSAYEAIHEAAPLAWFEPVGVLLAILLATGVGFVFEVKAEREFRVLNQVRDEQPVKVLRCPAAKAGASRPRLLLIPQCDVVVGDVVRLESGDLVPADGVLLDAVALRVDESNFTGEPYANKAVESTAANGRSCDKAHGTSATAAAEGAYPPYFLLRGSTVIEGTATYRVTATGVETEEGRGVMLTREGSEVKTPLNRQLDQLGKWISLASMVVALLIVGGRLLLFAMQSPDGGYDVAEWLQAVLRALMLAVTLIVVAVPEGLPMSITVSLALSMRKMLKENNLVRRLHACETMGAATVICTDKTGTLTQNRMSVVEHRFFGAMATDARLQALSMAVNATAQLSVEDGRPHTVGNPTECALLLWLHQQGCDVERLTAGCRVTAQQPFSTETKRMESHVALPDGTTLHLVKGAPEQLLARYGRVADGTPVADVEATLAQWQSRAMRTLAFAIDDAVVGIVGIADPIRPDVPEAIRVCRDQAGVDVIIVTGDTVGTAAEIGRQIGLVADGESGNGVMTGSDFAAMPDGEARALLRRHGVRIIARARPEDKARLVTLLQQNGEVVAVTGDGTNDAPALSKAQVGLSMGSGTSRAKDASDITIIDDSFASINKAILWGRSIYHNIQRFILYQMTINVCACLIVLIGAFAGLDSPLGVTQMLWVNLIMDTFAAMALSALPAEPRVLTERPRSPRAHIVTRAMASRMLGYGLTFTVVLALLWQLLYVNHVHAVTDLLSPQAWQRLQDGHLLHAQAMTPYEHALFFTTFVMLQFWNIFNARYYATGRSLLGDGWAMVHRRVRVDDVFSRSFLFILVVILLGQVAIVELVPDLFEVSRIGLRNWLAIIALTSPVFWIPDLWRTFACRRKL